MMIRITIIIIIIHIHSHSHSKNFRHHQLHPHSADAMCGGSECVWCACYSISEYKVCSSSFNIYLLLFYYPLKMIMYYRFEKFAQFPCTDISNSSPFIQSSCEAAVIRSRYLLYKREISVWCMYSSRLWLKNRKKLIISSTLE